MLADAGSVPMTLKEQLEEAGRKLAEEYARDLAGPPPRMPTDSRDLNAKLEERLWYCTEWAASKAYLAGRESLAPLLLEAMEALEFYATRGGPGGTGAWVLRQPYHYDMAIKDGEEIPIGSPGPFL